MEKYDINNLGRLLSAIKVFQILGGGVLNWAIHGCQTVQASLNKSVATSTCTWISRMYCHASTYLPFQL
eukprot:SAG11_NODE_115_length_16019_cov_12.462940_6_plen_69_part_00